MKLTIVVDERLADRMAEALELQHVFAGLVEAERSASAVSTWFSRRGDSRRADPARQQSDIGKRDERVKRGQADDSVAQDGVVVVAERLHEGAVAAVCLRRLDTRV